MQKDQVHNSEFNNIVFQGRNKSFGAFWLRQGYVRNLSIAFLISAISFTSVITAPALYEGLFVKKAEEGKGAGKNVSFEMTEVNLPPVESATASKAKPAPPPPEEKAPPPPETENLPPEVVQEMPEEVEEPEKPEKPDSVILASAENEIIEDPDKQTGEVFEEVDSADGSGTAGFDENSLVSHEASFPGGMGKMDDYIGKNIKHPAKDAGMTATVFLQFTIEKDGSVSNVMVLKGIHVCPECEENAVEVIKNMPTWKPLVRNGVPQKRVVKKSIEYDISDF